MLKKKRSFTLLEVLVVLIILGILAAALIPRINSSQARSRDTRRKVDLKNIFNANEIYRQNKGVYATGSVSCGYGNCAAHSKQAGWMADLSGIMVVIPVDPLNTAPNGFPWNNVGYYSYAYAYVYNNGRAGYDLLTRLENASDPDRCEIKKYTWNQGLLCPSATNYPMLNFSPESQP